MDSERRVSGVVVFFLLAMLWGCPPPEEPEGVTPDDPDPDTPAVEMDVREARAMMIDPEGETIGEIRFTSLGEEGVQVQGRVELAHVQPGARGFHVHELGACEPPGFQSAGNHFDPHDHPHGGRDDPPEARHVGDFGNIEVGEDRGAELDFVDDLVTLREREPESILGRAAVIHEGEDDLESQPDGDAGDPAACGVIQAGSD